ncbi:MAG: UDP-N-acetylmuramoyl-L-alanyl-D-glutamate--2,6-diaminopimelate ligase [Pseudonocardiales bacterium]|nr:UDP-N-acetylmuramoyl-L-alanyl-D-glutamate--2,6-diaminopimelate ligase [Pseudonocardiales bacterium]
MAESAYGTRPGPPLARPSHVAPVRLSSLAQLIGATLVGEDVEVRGVSSGSDLTEAGDLFAALAGGSGHGARFTAAAVAQGAVAVLTDDAGRQILRENGLQAIPLLLVETPRAVLGTVAAEIYGHPSRRLPVYGITGTSGKTTTTFLVRAGLLAAGRSSGLIGTVGVFLGDEVLKTPFTTPEAPQLQALLAVMVERGMSSVGMEVSSHALRMGRVDAVDFAVGAFTNLSQDHLDFHADMEDYFQAKALLFDGRSRREIVVVDDEWGPRLVGPDTVTVSRHHDAAWRASDITVAEDGATRFIVESSVGRFEAGCRIPGEYNVANTLLALAILAELGVDVVAVAPAVAAAQVRGRMERVDGDQPFLAVVDYSHKPAGVQAALEALRPLTAGRLIIVLGCGGDRDRGKRPVMGEVAARHADVLIVTDDNPRSEDPALIRAEMLAGARAVPRGDSAVIVEDGNRRSAIWHAVRTAGPGDTVLVAGKGHETGQQVGEAMLPFDDVSVVREALVAQGFTPTELATADVARSVNQS